MVGSALVGSSVGSKVGSSEGVGVGADGAADGSVVGAGVVGAGEAYSERRVGCGTVPSVLDGWGVL